MHYIPTTTWEDGTAELARCLVGELSEGKRVLWLVSGGSNINISVKVMDCITAENSKNLSIGLIDERYGPVGHPDSNWEQLQKAGFDPKNAFVLPVLQEGLSIQDTAANYSDRLDAAWGQQDKVLLQLGIGSDGHIAGILPHSPASLERKQLVSAYTGPDYERITISPLAFERKATGVVFAFGEAKKQQINDLRHKELDISEQPAQLLKLLQNVYFYSDQLGGTI